MNVSVQNLCGYSIEEIRLRCLRRTFNEKRFFIEKLLWKSIVWLSFEEISVTTDGDILGAENRSF